MDAKTAKTLNIRQLVAAAGGPAAFAQKYPGTWNPSQVSQWISPTSPKGIGHALARRIETACGKPVGWLDVNHSSPDTHGLYGASQDLIYRPEIVATALNWVRFEEGAIIKGKQQFAYPDDLTRAKRLLELCALIQADGGILTPEHTRELISAASARHHQGKGKDGNTSGKRRTSTRR